LTQAGMKAKVGMREVTVMRGAEREVATMEEALEDAVGVGLKVAKWEVTMVVVAEVAN